MQSGCFSDEIVEIVRQLQLRNEFMQKISENVFSSNLRNVAWSVTTAVHMKIMLLGSSLFSHEVFFIDSATEVFNLTKEDNVCQYVVRREAGKKKKAPKVRHESTRTVPS